MQSFTQCVCVYPLSGGQITLSLLAVVALGLNPQTVSETQHSLGEKSLSPNSGLISLRGAVSH